jgi:hypothetical protein
MVQLPRAFLQEAEFRAAVDRVAQSLAPDVERIITELDYDWSGEPVAWLMTIVSDDVYRNDRAHDVANEVRKLVREQIDPPQEWGIWAVVRIRTHTEQVEIERRNVA